MTVFPSLTSKYRCLLETNILPNVTLSHKYQRNILNKVIGEMISKTANVALRKILRLEDNRRTL